MPPVRDEIRQHLDSVDDMALSLAFGMKNLFEFARYSEEYQADDGWVSAIALTKYGRQMAATVSRNGVNVESPDFLLAAFGLFYGSECIIDICRTDLEWIRRQAELEINQRRLIIPNRSANYAYNRFQELEPHGVIEEIPGARVWELFSDLEQGVHQFGNLVFGPLGLCQSRRTRFFPLPDSRMVLCHVRDKGKTRAYPVLLTPPKIEIVRLYSIIAHALQQQGAAFI